MLQNNKKEILVACDNIEQVKKIFKLLEASLRMTENTSLSFSNTLNKGVITQKDREITVCMFHCETIIGKQFDYVSNLTGILDNYFNVNLKEVSE
ncbi:hypothetical protein ACIQ1D_18990 [Lysinibacillus xylanilyticus]|uniref:hypothetical protein n=1 Tax=Lysinibacillus xylanilyticus TaxID=582475 RepID=UPI00382CE463